ncbi:GntR family transcriptional regulator [Marinomonas sp. THO17]|uniref:GntR family transcriptional regulator n=1 Tax=Marinomonas sp. THO17 TaxID=3149048 RepID=UPI00336C1F27
MDLVAVIKEDILHQRLPTGVPLRQSVLSEQYAVSRIPVRDALLKLKGEGWLVAHGKAGVMIPELNWQEAEELAWMRAKLEVLALELAWSKLTVEHLSSAHSYLDKLEQKNLPLMTRGDLNWSFHSAIYEACQRNTLLRNIASLNQQASRYLGFQFGPLDYHQHSQQEHRDWLDCIKREDKTSAIVLLEKHILAAGQRLSEHLKRSVED